ncbi:MAG: hypothetical protein AAB426_10070, partial [Myxococcota bacterium]
SPSPAVTQAPSPSGVPAAVVQAPATGGHSWLSTPWWRTGHRLSLVAAGVGAFGAVAMGVGVVTGVGSARAGRDVDEIEHGRYGTTQLEAQSLERKADDGAHRANVLLGVGGVLVAVSASLLGVDWLVIAPTPYAPPRGGDQPSLTLGVARCW